MLICPALALVEPSLACSGVGATYQIRGDPLNNSREPCSCSRRLQHLLISTRKMFSKDGIIRGIESRPQCMDFFPGQVTDILWPAETDHIAGQWFRSFFKPSNLDLSRPGFNRSFQRFVGVGGPKMGRQAGVGGPVADGRCRSCPSIECLVELSLQ